MRMKPASCLSAVAALLIGGVAACHPGDISSVGEADLIVTLFDSTADFGSIATYAMPDTIIRVDENGGTAGADPVVDAAILAEVASQFDALGYTRLEPPFDASNRPDVVVLLEATRTDFVGWVPGVPPGWWGWWGWWPGWGGWCCYGPGWGPGYPWVPVTTSTGSLWIQMLDPEDVVSGPPQEIPFIWLGAVNGLLQGSTESILNRLDEGIGQLFMQSPYL